MTVNKQIAALSLVLHEEITVGKFVTLVFFFILQKQKLIVDNQYKQKIIKKHLN